MSELIFSDSEHLYMQGGYILPCVSDLCAPMYKEIYRDAPKSQMEAAAQRGTAVHLATQALDALGSADVPEEHLPYIQPLYICRNAFLTTSASCVSRPLRHTLPFSGAIPDANIGKHFVSVGHISSPISGRVAVFPLPPGVGCVSATPQYRQPHPQPARSAAFRRCLLMLLQRPECPPAVELRPNCKLFVKIPKSTRNWGKYAVFNATKYLFCCVRHHFAACFALGSSPPKEIRTSTGPVCFAS